MILERHFDPKRTINIHELSIEAPEKSGELPFDPERDLTEEDWERMKNELEADRLEPRLITFSRMASIMNLLYPERKSELGLDERVYMLDNDTNIEIIMPEEKKDFQSPTFPLPEIKKF